MTNKQVAGRWIDLRANFRWDLALTGRDSAARPP